MPYPYPHLSSPSSPHLGSTPYSSKVEAILHEAELSPPQRIPTLAEPQVRVFETSLPSNIDEARSLLVQQRTSEPGYRQPDQQKRHVFWSKKSIEAKCNTATWVFTNHEVAKAFDTLLSHTPLPSPDIAQALLSQASTASLEELWCRLCDPKVQERTESRSKNSRSSVLSKSISSVVLMSRSSVALHTMPAIFPEITWLDGVCVQENLDYIRLMCQAGLGQDALNRAFRIALLKHSMDAMEVLLSFGAVATTACQNDIQERFKCHDVALMRLLLSAPKAMSKEAWRGCLEDKWTQSPELAMLCMAHRPAVVSTHLVQDALELQNLPAFAIMLAYGRFSGQYYRDVRQLICEMTCRIQDDELRYRFFRVLAESGFVADSLVLRQELMKNVKTGQLPLAKLLVDAGVIVDMEPNSSFYWAVSQMNFETLELFKNGKFTSPISRALDFAHNSKPESDMLRLVEFLGPLGLAGQPLDAHLVRAVQRRYILLVKELILCGASIEFQQASAIHAALENADLDMLNILLLNKCSTQLLSSTIPTAMFIKPRSVRLKAMEALVEKGVLAQELGTSLLSLVSEEGDMDTELVQLLLQHKAPVDGASDDADNAVLAATSRGDVSVLGMLCDAGPRDETLCRAVPVAFKAIDTCGHDVALSMIKLLLKRGAAGLQLNQTLVVAAKKGKLNIVRLLVTYGADANYGGGAPFGIAFATSNFKLLEILCTSCPPRRETTESVLAGLDPRCCSPKSLELLLTSTINTGTTLDTLWSSERLRGNPNMTEIVSFLLGHGLDVNLENGVLLSFAIREKNVALLETILSADPSITSLSAAFHTATYAKPRSLELDAMKLLLEKAKSAEIGQSDSLLQQIYSALSGDFAGFRLLVRHEAVATPYTFTKAWRATAASTISWNQKQEIFILLLTPPAGVLTENLSDLLAHSLTSVPECTDLPLLLLSNGAEVKVQSIKVALEISSLNMLDVLFSDINSADKVLRTFQLTQQITMDEERRYWIYQQLFAKGIPRNNLSEALIASLEAFHLGDLTFPKLFLENGACPGYQKCEAFVRALRPHSPSSLVAVKLLIQYIVDDTMAAEVFNIVLKTPLLNEHVRAEIYRLLLEWNIGRPSIYQALVDSFKGCRPDTSFLQLLLAKGADPNEDNGHCFAVVAKTGALAEFRTLSKYADPLVVLKMLLDNYQEESEIVKWFKVCLEEQSQSWKSDQDELVFQCMRKFPDGTALLTFLLDQGLSASAKINHRLCAGWEPEPCTALIWAIFSEPRIENDVILVLLSRGDEGMLHFGHLIFPHN